MNQQPTITYPTIDLFLYDLRDGLGQDEEKVQENRKQFWKKVYPNLDEKQLDELADKSAKLEKAEADYVELLIPQRQEEFKPNLEGYYYALQFGDTFALQVDCSLINPNQGNLLNSFTPIKQEIETRLASQKGKIGQTWFVWCQLEQDYQNLDKIAKDCCRQLVPNPNWVRELHKHGELAGATLFELWHPPTDWADERSLQENFHLIIALFPHKTSRGLFNNRISIDSINHSIANLYFDLLRLFCYRHKITWAYHQSRCLKAELKKDFTQVQKLIRKVSDLPQQINLGSPNLKELQTTLTDTLTILSRYAINLSYLDDQGRTLKVNLENYKKRLEKIAGENSNSKLEIFEIFGNLYAEKYLAQVEADYANLSPGLMLLENLITTIEGTIEIYQAKRDRTLNTTVAIAGIGLATSQIASAVILTQDTPNPQVSLSYRTEAFFWSLGIGAIAMLITLSLLGLFRR
ncbi:MAG: hypothetical protein AB1589_11945 [Cyanobacteriota bacterium]